MNQKQMDKLKIGDWVCVLQSNGEFSGPQKILNIGHLPIMSQVYLEISGDDVLGFLASPKGLNFYKKAEESPETFAESSWCFEDVKTLRPKWSQAKCEEFLNTNGKYIQEASIRAGWAAMEALL